MASAERGFWQGVWRRNWLAMLAVAMLSLSLVAGFVAIGRHYADRVANERVPLQQDNAAGKFANKRAVVAAEVRSLANRTQQRLADINASVSGRVRSV